MLTLASLTLQITQLVLIVVKVSLVRLAAIEVRREAFDVQLRNVDLVDDSTEEWPIDVLFMTRQQL